jgi:DNA invertase Pin-like site-specific DNA recombinase
MSKTRVKAVGYLRTSSAANVGADKDSDKRQRAAIMRFCKSSGHVVADDDWYYDEAVSGADALAARAGWNALMARILSNGVRTVIVEDASRFARQLMVQEQGIMELRKAGVTVLTASGDDLTASNDPGRTMIRQIMGSFSEYEKARLVQKLKAARDRKIEAEGRCGGRQPISETAPDAVALARKLAHGNRKMKLSLRGIAAELAKAGYMSSTGKPYSAKLIRTMVEG